jgi:transcriptional regulator of acetoin/glycerol metabolism
VLSLIELERRHILRAMKVLGGNKARVAELLGIDRSTLYRRLERYGIPGSN